MLRGALVQQLVRRVITLCWVEDLEAQVLDRNLPVFDAEQLLNKDLEVVLDSHQQVRRLLESDVHLTLLAEAFLVAKD